ncbi:MAG TPA: hypothetical protein VK846_18855 [Candidatus Limnocylindria bacterium]|nr:hypothetical protein [Candidatus Limnocylindria bacterium]
MKMKLRFWVVPVMSAALLVVPTSVRADDADDAKAKIENKITEANRKTHEKICQGHHGTVTAKTDNSVTINDKQYAMTADAQVNKQGEPVLLKTLKTGDFVCFTTQKAADGSSQISQVIALDNDQKVRVREREGSSPSKEVETPNKKNDVK